MSLESVAYHGNYERLFDVSFLSTLLLFRVSRFHVDMQRNHSLPYLDYHESTQSEKDIYVPVLRGKRIHSFPDLFSLCHSFSFYAKSLHTIQC